MTNSLFWRTFAHSWPTVRRYVLFIDGDVIPLAEIYSLSTFK